MWGYFMLFAGTVFFGSVAYETHTSQQILATEKESAALAGNMLVYRKYVLGYAAANPGVSGSVADTNLNLPSWFSHNSMIVNYVSGGIGYVYITAAKHDIAYQISKSTGNRVKSGVKVNGQLISPLRSEQITLPATIPDGSTVTM